MGGHIPDGNFLGGNFPGGSFPGGNFPSQSETFLCLVMLTEVLITFTNDCFCIRRFLTIKVCANSALIAGALTIFHECFIFHTLLRRV